MPFRTTTFTRLIATKPLLQQNLLRSFPATTPRPQTQHERSYHRLSLQNHKFNNDQSIQTSTPSLKFQTHFLSLPSMNATAVTTIAKPKCFSTLPTPQQTAGPNMSAETAREKAEAGKQEAEADLGVRLSGNDFARSQSVTWHRKKDGTTPPYEYREIGGKDVQDNEGVVIPGKRGKPLSPLLRSPRKLL
jgi:hypothetical protein